MDAIYQHFRKDEAPLIDELAEHLNLAATEYRPVLTDFLDPRQIHIARVLTGSDGDVKCHVFGGYIGAERARIIFAPAYFAPDLIDFEVAPLEINYPEKFAEMHHSNVLGTMANAGIKRTAFGDIITDGQRWQLFTTQTMSDWVQSNITKIGRIGVRLEPIGLDQVVTPANDWQPLEFSVTTLRLDSLVAHAFSMSRARAKALVEAQKVRLNFEVMTRPDEPVGQADLISVRGFGRVRITALLGISKKGKQRLATEVIHK
ncbi:YlmH family RNA-binding protein [Lacticaseibacillus suibinensis]|uniref:YlmH family RNA-binding protein n=1 Tax=Lacticaseibacillus suibinensis TaxID=2486011 RepID=UPI000F7B3708|nr:YlmH/Sll1252 family protein [Lacticaseibacillus suibinensis]